MRVALIADSLALPRPGSSSARGGVRHDETYPAQLRRLAADSGQPLELIELARRNRLMTEVPYLVEDALLYDVGDIFVHVGICDCAPRVFSRGTHDFVAGMPNAVRNRVLGFVSKHRRTILTLRRGGAAYTVPGAFERAVRTSIENARVAPQVRIHFLNVAPGDADLLHKSPGYEARIQAYNELLATACRETDARLIDVHASLAGRMETHSVDGQHPNAAGNAVIARRIWDALRDRS